MATKRYDSLDGLRGVSALSVVLFHADGLFHRGPLMPHGFLAVDVFFILSGFVIALNYESALGAGLTLTRFAGARARRLLPVYWLGAAFNNAVFIVMVRLGYYPPGANTVLVCTLVPLLTLLLLPAFGAPGDGFSPPTLNVSWSLFVEWLVNLGYASRLFRCRTGTLACLALGGWLVMAVAGYFTGRGWCVGISRYDVFTYGLLRGVSGFLAGVVICRLNARGLFARLPSIATGLLLLLWLGIAVVPTFTATPGFDAISVILLSPALIILLIRSDQRTPAFARILGGLSYPLYTVHPGFILLAQATPLFGLNHGPNPVRAFGVVILCLVAAGVVQMLSRLLSFPKIQRPALSLR